MGKDNIEEFDELILILVAALGQEAMELSLLRK